MNKDNLIKDVLSLIHNQNIENEIREALSPKPVKRISKTLKPKGKTSDDFEIYYDQASGEAVGIVYKNIVFLKHISEGSMKWNKAVAYCRTIVINGIKAQLCPVDENWRKELVKISKKLCLALKKIGAVHLDSWIWASEYSYEYACTQHLSSGSTGWNLKNYTNYVRPVLVLK